MSKAAKKNTKAAVPLTVGRKELLIDGSDNAFREMVHDALAFTVRLAAMRDGFAKFIGLTGIQYTILVSVAHLGTEGDVGVSEVARHLSLSGTFVTTEVRKMVENGLLIKQPRVNDRRRVRLALTAKSKKLLKDLSRVQRDINDVHFEPLSRQDFQRMRKLMKQLTQSTDRALKLIEHELWMADQKQ